jgi:hypothetical protein
MQKIFNVHNFPSVDLNENNANINGYLDTIITQKHRLVQMKYNEPMG